MVDKVLWCGVNVPEHSVDGRRLDWLVCLDSRVVQVMIGSFPYFQEAFSVRHEPMYPVETESIGRRSNCGG